MATMLPLLLLLLLLVPADVVADADDWCQPRDEVELNFESFETGNDYDAQIFAVFNKVVGLSRYYVYGRPVLARQTGKEQPPPRWLLVVARGRGGDYTKLAIRQDNLYLGAFTDKTGQWYTFIDKDTVYMIPGVTIVDFGDIHSDLVGLGGYKNLEKMKVGRESTLRAIATIANYDYSPHADQGCLARAIAMMVLTVCEANRFLPIARQIRANWETGVFVGSPLNSIYMVKWKIISCGLMVARQNGGRWGSPAPRRRDEATDLRTELNITSLRAARDSVFVLLWPPDERRSEHINWLH